MCPKIFLTGASGFIGKNIQKYLDDKYNVFAPTHHELDLLDSLSVDDFIKNNNIDIIIHAAVGSGKNLLKDTMRMSANILRNSEKVAKTIIFGSGAEYSKSRHLYKVREEEIGEHIPHDDYGIAKYFINEAIKGQVNVVNLRLFGVFGKYEDYRHKFISNTIVKSLLGMDIIIAQDVVFDYLYVEDLKKIVEYFIINGFKHNDYNITPLESISLIEIAEIIKTATKSSSNIVVINEGKNFQYTASNDRLIQQLGDFTFSPYVNSIKKLIEYYSSSLGVINREDLIADDYLKISLEKMKRNTLEFNS